MQITKSKVVQVVGEKIDCLTAFMPKQKLDDATQLRPAIEPDEGIRTFCPMPLQPLQLQPLKFQPFILSTACLLTACHFKRVHFQPPQIQPFQISSNQLNRVTMCN